MIDESNVLTVKINEPQEREERGKVRYTAYSSIGARSSQQDTLFVGEKEGYVLAVVCDGMGGMNGGETASALAVQMMAESFYGQSQPDVPEYLREMAVRMDEAVSSLEEGGRNLGAGTTIVSVMITQNGVYWLSVGDSRIYLYRNGQMICPVPAHNYRLLLEQRLQAGKITPETYEKELPKAEALISFLGIGGIRRMEMNQSPFIPEPGDQILLCSDGLYKSLSDDRILDILKLQMSPEIKAKHLVDEALKGGGTHQDNTSVILLEL